MSPSINHSYICTKILASFFETTEFEAFIELTLDIQNGITPDISVFKKKSIKPNFWKDKTKCDQMPLLAIEVLSPTQGMQELIDKAEILLVNNIESIWIIDSYTQSILVFEKNKQTIVHNSTVTSSGITVDFKKIFSDN